MKALSWMTTLHWAPLPFVLACSIVPWLQWLEWHLVAAALAWQAALILGYWFGEERAAERADEFAQRRREREHAARVEMYAQINALKQSAMGERRRRPN